MTQQTQIGQATAQDLEIIGRIIEEANRAINEGKVGIEALLLWRGEVLAQAHNSFEETQDITAHAEMTVLRQAALHLAALPPAEKALITIYSTLEPCLMCFSAISQVGIKRLVFAALVEDGSDEVWTARGLTCGEINPLLVKGPLEIIEGVQREAGKQLLVRMGKAAK